MEACNVEKGAVLHKALLEIFRISEHPFRSATRWEEGGDLPCPILKIRKICIDCVYLSVKFSSKNVVLKVSRKKNSQIFPCKTFFPGVLKKMFIKVP